ISLYLLALLGLTVLVGCGKKEEAAGAPKGGFEMIIPVTTAKASAGDVVQEATFTGSVRWPSRVELRSELSARVLSINLREGNKFAASDTLVTLDGRDFELELERLEAERAKALRVVEELKTPTRAEIVDRHRAELAQAEARVVE